VGYREELMKALGVLIIGLGLLMITIGVQGSQHTVLNTIKGIPPVLRKDTGTTAGPTSATTLPKTTAKPPPVGTA